MTDIPHFDLPFRYESAAPVVVEQDSDDDVVNCVESIVRTTKGDRLELPDFGGDDLVFADQPINVGALLQTLALQEPRAVSTIDQSPDALDNLIAHLRVNVTHNQEG